TGPSNETSRLWNRGLMPADFALSGDLLVDSLQPVQFLVRGQNLAGDTPTYYAVSITRGMMVQFIKVVDGVTTVLASLATTGYFSQKWAHVAIKPQGDKFAVEIYRPDIKQYLSPDGLWESGALDAIQVTDASIPGAGYIGISRPATYAGS